MKLVGRNAAAAAGSGSALVPSPGHQEPLLQSRKCHPGAAWKPAGTFAVTVVRACVRVHARVCVSECVRACVKYPSSYALIYTYPHMDVDIK